MRIAIVGTGGVAQRHLGVLRQLPDLGLVGHLSAGSGRAEAQASRWGGRGYTDLAVMLDRERPEAVWLCVTPERHGPAEAALAEQGIPFFVEKPLAADLATAERVAALVARRSLIVGVGYKFRALDTLPKARALLNERRARMLLLVWHDALPPPAWWRDPARGGGQIVEQATHLVDLARHLVGEGEVISAQAQPLSDERVPEVSVALLRFDGVPGLLSATCLLAGRQAIHLQLVCQGRVLTITERSLLIETGESADEHPVTVDPFLVEDAAFLRAVREHEPAHLLSSYADALKSHALCCAIRDAYTDTVTAPGWRG